MNVVFYVNSSENNKIGKTLNNETVLQGSMRESVDIINPSFNVVENPRDFNYCYIEEFKRYYFITGIENVRTGLWRVDCIVDVLQTYEDMILALTCIIDKQQNISNKYLDDGSWVTENRVFNRIVNFDVGFLEEPVFILMTAGATQPVSS